MEGTIMYNGSASEPFDIRSREKQGSILAPTLFGIFSSFAQACLWMLFKLFRLRAMTKVQTKCHREFLFTDNVAVTTHSKEDHQQH